MSHTRVLDRAPVRLLNSSGMFLALALAFLLLAACDTAEERAEAHFESGMELIEEGRIAQALVEFRNVFQLNPKHKEARRAYAEVQRERGFLGDAIGHYLRLVEQYPDDFEGRIALSQLSVRVQNWEELQRHAEKAYELNSEDINAKSLNNMANYVFAVREENEEVLREAVALAQQLIEEDDTLYESRRIVIDELVRESRFEDALAEIALAHENTPEDLTLYQLRLGILQRLGDMDEMRETLEEMAEKFPDNADVKDMLVRVYVNEENIDAAEAVLRKSAEETEELAATGRLVTFLVQFRGVDATRTELKRIIEEGRLSPIPFQSALARLEFDQGNRAEAISQLEAVSDLPERSSEIRDSEMELARMYVLDGNAVAARSLVERVLEEDGSHAAAVKLKAAWLIEDDETEDAIILLRDALSAAPREADFMTLMAQAYEREGSRQLMAEMLSLAVEASNNRPREALRYASFLANENRFQAAENAIIDALRLAPTDNGLLSALGRVYVGMENWTQAGDVINRLRELDTDESRNSAQLLTAQVLAGQERGDELRELLAGMAEAPGAEKAAKVAIFRSLFEDEGPQSALDYLETLLAEEPGDPVYRYLKAGALVAFDRRDESAKLYREIVEEDPSRTNVWINLYRLALFAEDKEGARAILDEALAANPGEPALQLALADELQRRGDFDGAIAIYEALYEINTNSLVVANNLASLLAEHRTDDESIERAYRVARRLKDAEIPQLKDTYGWIAFRKGNVEEALPYIRDAAEALPDNDIVLYHYGKILAATGEKEAALEQFRNVMKLLEDGRATGYLDDLKAEMAKLESGDDN